MRVWSWDNPEHLTKLETSVFAGAVLDVDWDFESKKIVAVGEGSGQLAKVFTWDTGNSAGELVGHNKRILSVSFKSSRPFRIISGGEDMRTIFYSGPPFKFTHSNSTHSNFVNCVKFSPDGTALVSVGSDKKIQFYDGTTGEPSREIVNAHDGSIFSASFSADGARLLTASGDKTVKVWDVATLTTLKVFNFSESPQVGDMQVAAFWVGPTPLSLSLNGDINVLDLTADTVVRLIQGHQVAITSMYLDRANSVLFTGSYDGVIISRNLVDGVTRKFIGIDKKSVSGSAHAGKIVGIGMSHGDLVSVGWDDTARFAALTTSSYYGDISLIGQPVALASSSTVTITATNSQIFIITNQSITGSLGSLGYTPTSVALYNETEVAVGGDDSKVHIYSIGGTSLTAVATIDTRAVISALSYSSDGLYLAVGDTGRQVDVFERGSWLPKVKGKWVFHTSKITTLSWSPSGHLLASGSLDENIFIWKLNDPSSKVNFPFAHMGGVTGVDWLSDTSLVSVGNDHTVVTWRVPA